MYLEGFEVGWGGGGHGWRGGCNSKGRHQMLKITKKNLHHDFQVEIYPL